MTSERFQSDFVDRLYAVAMEPERFAEIVQIWQDRLNAVSDDDYSLLAEDIRHLESHISRAETLLTLVTENEDSLPTPLIEKLNSEPQAMLALDLGGVIQAQNTAAKGFFGDIEGSGLKSLPFETDALDAIRKETSRLQYNDEADVRRRLLPSTRSDTGQQLILSFAHWATPGGRRLLLLKTVDFAWPDHLTPLVIDAFGLTLAEAEVMQLLVEGRTAAVIAEDRQSSLATVRTQVRSIYAKTATRNQSEFMRMAIGLTTLQLADRQTLSGAFPATGKADLPPSPKPDQRRLFELPDGRLLDYAEFGLPDGIPCLYFHSEFFGDVWPADLVQTALREGLRVIAPARPNYARSTSLAKSANAYDQAAVDTLALLDHLKIDHIINVTQGVGGVFSVKFASDYPERNLGIVSVAPMFPVIAPEDEANMPMFARFVANVVTRNPRMLKFMARLALTYHNRVGSRRFLAALYQDTPADLAIVEDPDNLEAIIQGFEFSATNGYDGYLHDFRQLLPDRAARWTRIKAPHVALIGDSDNNTRVTRAERLNEAGASIKIEMFVGGGSLLFFSHPEAVVRAIVAIWNSSQA